jgi:hypothetical protein
MFSSRVSCRGWSGDLCDEGRPRYLRAEWGPDLKETTRCTGTRLNDGRVLKRSG